jgi:hypothetical protein
MDGKINGCCGILLALRDFLNIFVEPLILFLFLKPDDNVT